MDRLIALVRLRWRMEFRTLLWARERVVGLLLLAPVALFLSGFVSFLAYVGVRGLERARPDAVLPLLSAAATCVGILWALSPLLTGLVLAETHDLTRLLHFPIPLITLVASSLVANLAQPMVLAELPIIAALSFALADSLARLPLVGAGLLLAFGFVLAAAQLVGLLLHALSRNRRVHDVVLFAGLGAGFLVSVAPLLVLAGAGGPAARVGEALVSRDLFAASPYAWGVRAAVHAGRGELPAFLLFGLAGAAAVGGAMAASTALIHRIYRGELDLGVGGGAAGRPARMPLPGALGALVEKDLRMAWRDPASKAGLVIGLAAPLLLLFFLSRGHHDLDDGSPILLLASFVGVSAFGANALGLERRGIALLFAFPVERWRMLVGKNLAAVAGRLPSLLTLLLASLYLGPLACLPAALCIALSTLLIAAGVDNYMSILFPVTAPAAGKNPYGSGTARGRGLVAAAFGMLFLSGALFVAAPFVFLAWLPLLLRRPWLWLGSLPLALAGACSAYAMLAAGAARLLWRREPDLLERILGEE